MREMAEEFCDCANKVVSHGVSSYYVMDSCASNFMDYNKYPVFYYSNGGTPPVGEEKISEEEFEELSDQYKEFLDHRNEICGH